MLHLGIITLFPEMFQSLSHGVIGRALSQGHLKIEYWNPRAWSLGKYHQVDDRPYGGGPGMVMRYEPLAGAITAAKAAMPENCKTIYLSPQGKKLAQKDFNELAEKRQALLFIAGRYEGIDERIITQHVDEEWSLGDFILSGGEFAAMVFIDALARLLPGVLGHEDSPKDESFMEGLLEYPQYTRPASIDGNEVPAVLLQGNHRDILQWRLKQALGNTWLKRPDLLEKKELIASEQSLLAAFQKEFKDNKGNFDTIEFNEEE